MTDATTPPQPASTLPIRFAHHLRRLLHAKSLTTGSAQLHTDISTQATATAVDPLALSPHLARDLNLHDAPPAWLESHRAMAHREHAKVQYGSRPFI